MRSVTVGIAAMLIVAQAIVGMSWRCTCDCPRCHSSEAAKHFCFTKCCCAEWGCEKNHQQLPCGPRKCLPGCRMIHAFLPTSKVRVNKAHDSAWIALTPATISSICDRFDAQLLASGTAGSRLVVPPLRIHVLNQIWLI